MLDVLLPGGVECAPDGGRNVFVRSGGAAATVASVLARDRWPVVVVGKTGPDPNSRRLRADLEALGVRVPVEPETSAAGGLVVLHRVEGRDRVTYVERGANRRLQPADVEPLLPAVESAAWLHISGYCLLEPGPVSAVRLLAQRARSAGVPVSVDPGDPQAHRGAVGPEDWLGLLSLGLDAGPDFLFPSADAARFLTGLADVAEATVALAGRFAGAVTVVTKDGPAGAWLGDRRVPLGPGRARPGADLSGAGDVFNACFIAAVLDGLNREQAAERANEEAAAFVRAGSALSAAPAGGGPVRPPGWEPVAVWGPPVIVSACLFDTASAYDGRVKGSVGEPGRLYLPICPEQAGGLPTPRDPAEIEGRGGGEAVIRGQARVVDREGRDVTAAYLRGARRAVELARAAGVRRAVLKDGSPSCGVTFVHDGTFRDRHVPGRGVAAAALAEAGVEIEAGP